jgi:phage terminase large subunit-like protein
VQGLKGSTQPRIAPPLPRRSLIAEYRRAAALYADHRKDGWSLIPWQDLAARYVTATNGVRWLYHEVCIVVARQNGKSTLLVPRIVMGLLRNERITHAAQDRNLPREVYGQVADIMETQFAGLLASYPRRANGQEQVRTVGGGSYRIVASSTAGARGFPNDLVIIDELQELDDFDFISAVRPTLMTSTHPQILEVATAGEETSVVLNAVKKRAETDTHLAYLEWSSSPERSPDDRRGWAEANPALGHLSAVAENLELDFEQYPLPVFEREHLCRWVVTTLPKMVSDVAWARAGTGTDEPPRHPSMGIKVDPSGRRVSAALAWMTGGKVNVRVCAEADGKVDLDDFAKLLIPIARQLGVREVGFDPATDRDLERLLSASLFKVEGINGDKMAGASERFASSVEAGRLQHDGNDLLTADMAYTVRREMDRNWYATVANTERPTTASFAAIRAVWLATAQRPKVRIH